MIFISFPVPPPRTHIYIYMNLKCRTMNTARRPDGQHALMMHIKMNEWKKDVKGCLNGTKTFDHSVLDVRLRPSILFTLKNTNKMYDCTNHQSILMKKPTGVCTGENGHFYSKDFPALCNALQLKRKSLNMEIQIYDQRGKPSAGHYYTHMD